MASFWAAACNDANNRPLQSKRDSALPKQHQKKILFLRVVAWRIDACVQIAAFCASGIYMLFTAHQLNKWKGRQLFTAEEMDNTASRSWPQLLLGQHSQRLHLLPHRGCSALELLRDALQLVVETPHLVFVQTALPFKRCLRLLKLVSAEIQPVKQHCHLPAITTLQTRSQIQ